MHGVNDRSESESESELVNTELNLEILREPLEKGWRRETVVSSIGRDFQIEGHVRYYAPGSQVELRNIVQIQTVCQSYMIRRMIGKLIYRHPFRL